MVKIKKWLSKMNSVKSLMVVIVSKVGNLTFDQTRFGPKIMPRLCAFILFRLL